LGIYELNDSPYILGLAYILIIILETSIVATFEPTILLFFATGLAVGMIGLAIWDRTRVTQS